MSNGKILRSQTLCFSDQYADGKAARVWELYLGSKQERTGVYREWFSSLLRKHDVETVHDAACGTGVDSVMLLEEGFRVVSTDASDKMLKYALAERWTRRKDPAFDDWVIGEANWLSLKQDVMTIPGGYPEGGFDALICLGNSFAHLPDNTGTQRYHIKALRNMRKMLKPGGIMLIDHRNYDYILRTGSAPKGKNVYYPSPHIRSIKTSNIYVDNKPCMITLDYTIDITALLSERDITISSKMSKEEQNEMKVQHFHLSYYPHTLDGFNALIDKVFPNSKHEIYGDFKLLSEIEDPAYYIHVIKN